MSTEKISAKPQLKIAWLLPFMGTGGISFQHLLCEFSQIYPQTITFTGGWPGYAKGFADTFAIEQVGATRYIKLGQTPTGYSIGFSYVSPNIAWKLLKYRPDVVLVNAFSVWTAIALLLKPIGRWQVILILEGGSPSVNYERASLRILLRRFLARQVDAFVANGQRARDYLTKVVGAAPNRVFDRPFLVPSLKALEQSESALNLEDLTLAKPVFLYVGQLIARKGFINLIEACSILMQQGAQDFSLLVVGDGEQRAELEAIAASKGLQDKIRWLGKVPYSSLGQYFKLGDVFIFPTYEDIWGMVLTEAMAYGKPVICSEGAGAAEMVLQEENGMVYDPHQPKDLAKYMSRFIDEPELIETMGHKSQEIMSQHTPSDAITSFARAVSLVAN
ncbi:MAG: glycosyltransferase family 4 protein [Cyanobacteria bacterium J06643_13]